MDSKYVANMLQIHWPWIPLASLDFVLLKIFPNLIQLDPTCPLVDCVRWPCCLLLSKRSSRHSTIQAKPALATSRAEPAHLGTLWRFYTIERLPSGTTHILISSTYRYLQYPNNPQYPPKENHPVALQIGKWSLSTCPWFSQLPICICLTLITKPVDGMS